MQDYRERAAFTLSRSIKNELEETVPPSKRSKFVEQAIADALLKEAKRRAIESLQTMKVYDTGGRDSVEVLRQIRRERADHVALRHRAAK
jgi:metal-responsive CopG/Arc/MetJ family transcriptional regulator